MTKRLGLLLVVVAGVLIATLAPRSIGSAPLSPKRPMPVGISPGGGFRNLDDELLAEDLDRMVDLGVTWIRLDVDWSVAEPRRGEWSWASTDRVIEAARDRGLEVLGLLSYTPEWARPPETSSKYPPVDLAEFARFAAAAAERYGPIGVHSWEIWNEPNVQQFWAPEPEPARYATLVALSVERIRAVDPSAFIISGGLAPATDSPAEELSPQRFLREFYHRLGPGKLDAVAIHPYSYPAAPSDRAKSWNLFGQLPEISALVEHLEGRLVPLWLTEFGAPFDHEDPERQSQLVTEGVVCATQWSGAGAIFVYALRDLPDPTNELKFGLLDEVGGPRPSWEALALFVDQPPGTMITSPCQSFGDNAS